MRTRYLKPGFFENEYLAVLPAPARLLFAGLWLMADREGRLKDRPARIKGELFPYDNTNVAKHLTQLAEAGFIKRYEMDGQRLIWIPTFLNHQKPYQHEPGSTLPPHPDDDGDPLVHQSSANDGPMSDTKVGKEIGNSNSTRKSNEEREPSTPAGDPSSGFAGSSWDFLRALYLQNIGTLTASDGSTLRGFLGRGMPDDWMAAAINETSTCDKPGMGYLLKILKRCEETTTPPSSLKKSRTG